MGRKPGRKIAQVLSVVMVVVTILAGVVVARVAGSGSGAAVWELGGEGGSMRRGAPRGGAANESEDIEQREIHTFNRLAYPTGRIPAAWRSRARAQVQQRVPDGLDFPGQGRGVGNAPATGANTGSTGDAGAPANTGAATDSGTAADTEMGIASVESVGSTSWTSMGPAPIDNNAASAGYKYGLVTGRINAIAVDPTNAAIAYAGATAGGLWKTTTCCSASTTWTPLWEGKDTVSQAVGAIKIDPSNPNVVYAGTGDFDAADQYGEGIMKTTDGGASWMQLGTDVFTPFAAGTPDKPEQNIGAIELDPNNPNTVIVGTRHGFFMSYDGGISWTRYDVHTRSGQSQRVSSIVVDGSTNPATMYVAIGYPYTSRLYGNVGGGNGVYKATIPAAGAPAFTLLNNGWPTGTGGGTANAVGRIRLAKSAQNSQLLYAQVSDYSNMNALGTWITRDGGSTWTQLSGSADTNYKNCSNQATNEGQDWYDLFIGVDPSNDKTLYIGRTSLYKATVNSTYTGFSSISDLANVYATSCAGYGTIHPDQHAVAMISSTQFLVGNDGGVYLGNGAVGGFTPLNNNFNITQFYAGQLGANYTSSTSQYAFGGSQDNGSESWDASNTTKKWQARGNGGDGFFAAFDPIAGTLTSGNWYTEYTYGDLDCSTTGARGAFNTCRGGWYTCRVFSCSNERTDWSTPFVLDQVHCTTTNCKNLILGTYRLWASGTGGTSSSGWTAVSPDLTKGDIGGLASHTIIDVRFAPSNPKSAVVGTDDGNVSWSNNIYTGTACTQAAANTSTFACTPNTSATWVNLSGNNAVLPNRAIQGVGFDPTNDQIVYAAVGGFDTNTPNTPGHLFQASCAANCTTAAGWTWTNKTGNLPDVPANSVIVNPNNAKQVFVATHFGFYYTNDITAGSVTWQRYQNNLPNTVLQYLTVDRGATTLGLFTYGRSLYTIQLPGATGFDGGVATPTPTPSVNPTATATATSTPVTTSTATSTPTTNPTATSTPTPSVATMVGASGVQVTGTRSSNQKNTSATAKVTIVDANKRPVAGATVTGDWTGGYSGSGTATTDSTGVATFTTPGTRNGANVTYTFTVSNVSAPSATWDGVRTSGQVTIP